MSELRFFVKQKEDASVNSVEVRAYEELGHCYSVELLGPVRSQCHLYDGQKLFCCEEVEKCCYDECVFAEDEILQDIPIVDFVILSLHKPSIIDKNIFSLEKELFSSTQPLPSQRYLFLKIRTFSGIHNLLWVDLLRYYFRKDKDYF